MSSTDIFTPGLLALSNTLKSPTDGRALGVSCEGILGPEQKAPSLSQFVGDGNSVTASLRNREDGDCELNPLKRRGADTASAYPRRRATIACEICRSRKSRCDGSKPKCRLCIELGVECLYREPGIKLDAGDKLILEHLARIEDLLQSNLDSHKKHLPGSPTTSNRTTMGNDELNFHNHVNSSSGAPPAGLKTWASHGTNISTMPKEHTNLAFHLLQWPFRDLVSRPYNPQVLLQLEMSREPLALPKPQCMDLFNNAKYIQAFFSRVNIWYACVNPYNWPGYYRTALSNGFREGPESCIVLLVLALGQASICGSISRISLSSDPPGLSYFSLAWSLLPNLMIRNTVLSTQCMVLAAAYLFYLVRPLEAWTVLSSTSTKLHLLLSRSGRMPAQERELSERVYWNALLFESDLLAELDLPHSGIVQFEESVGLPGEFTEFEQYEHIRSSNGNGESHAALVGRDDLWYFLAEIALRRLLIRACQLIYGKDSVATTSALEPVVAELDFQLGQWYESLPLPLQFPYTRGLLTDPVQIVLRLRFFACKTTIFRPYVLTVMDNEQAALNTVVMENCRKCLDAAVRQLDYTTAHHAGHMPYLWQGALSIVSQTLLVMGATMSPSLAPLLPPPPEMDVIINGVVEEIARYSHLAPSLALSAEIIREAECRRQDILRNL